MNLSRRTFVKATATLPFLPSLSYANIIGANERLNVAFIGTGGMGTDHATKLAKRVKEEMFRLRMSAMSIENGYSMPRK